MVSNHRWLLVAYVFGASTITIFQRYLTFHFDTFTQSFFRFLSGSVALFLIVHFLAPTELRRLLRQPGQVLAIGLMSLFLVFSQYLCVEGLTRTSAVLAGLIATLGIPLTIALAALLFMDERQAFRNRTFLLGLLLALGGALGMPLLQGELTGAATVGAWQLILSTVIVAVVTVWIKKLLRDTHPLCLAALNCGFTCLFFFPAALLWGDLGQVARAAFLPNLVLFFSGAFGLVVGGWLAMVCIHRAGAITTRLAELSMPVIIGLLGYLLFGETLSVPELIAGAAVVTGCGLVLRRTV